MSLTSLKNTLFAAMAALVLAGPALAEDLDTDEAVASYGIGYGFANSLLQQTEGVTLDADAMEAGLRAAMAGEESELSNADINAAIQALQQQLQAQQAAPEEGN